MTDQPLHDEFGRMAALKRLDVLDTLPEAQFEKIIGLVRSVLGVPIATVTLVDAQRQWFKAQAGMPCAQTPRDVSFCTHTIQQRDALVVENALEDERFCASPLVVGEPHIRAYAGVPLRTPDGYNVGALCAIDVVPRSFSGPHLDILANFASLVVDELELRQIASSDQLTGSLSRRGFIVAVAKEMERCRRHGRDAALAVLDVDHFKRVNDTYGHSAGDVVLREVVSRCASTVRPNDVIGRLGGEEFAILLPETSAETAQAAIERVRTAIGEAGIDLHDGVAVSVTASFGIAPLDASDTPEEWIARADAPLYEAKRTGRNRAIVAQPSCLRAA